MMPMSCAVLCMLCSKTQNVVDGYVGGTALPRALVAGGAVPTCFYCIFKAVIVL